MFERRSAGVICHSLTQCTLVSSEERERERDIFWSLLIIDTPILNLNRIEVASHYIIRTVRISELKKKKILGDHRRGIFTWTTHTRTHTPIVFFLLEPEWNSTQKREEAAPVTDRDPVVPSSCTTSTTACIYPSSRRRARASSCLSQRRRRWRG